MGFYPVDNYIGKRLAIDNTEVRYFRIILRLKEKL
nr:MAG TPA: hypothetical protein [Caudoviricetes sp.]